MGRSPPVGMVLVLVLAVFCCGLVGGRRSEALSMDPHWSSNRLAGSSPHSLHRRQLQDGSSDESSDSDSACVVRHIKDGEFKRQCRSIKAECDQKQCPENTVCGLDLDENIECFDESVRDFQNCGPEKSRLQQPCPADAGIRGFGMGCNFCEGGNPFTGGPEPGIPTPDEPFEGDSACVVRHIKDGEFKKQCRSIKTECDQKQCPGNTVCGLDLDENIECFDASVRDFQNCGPEEFRLQQPCPADAGIRGFGIGCTFCEGYLPGGKGNAPPALRSVSHMCLFSAFAYYLLL